MMPDLPKYPSRADKIAIAITVAALMVGLIFTIVDGCYHTEEATMKMLNEHYPSSEIRRTHVGVYLVRLHNGTILEVREGGLITPKILSETILFNSPSTF